MVLCDVRWSDAKDCSYGDRKNYTDVLEKSDVDIVYNLSIKNSIYYQYHPSMVTRASILEE